MNRPSSTHRAAISPETVRALLPFLIPAAVATIAGGLVAAVASAAPFDHGAWIAAYLVLVNGVALAGLAGVTAALGAEARLESTTAYAVLALFHVANTGVIVGTVTSTPSMVVAGAVILAAVFVWFASIIPRSATPRWLALADRGLLVFLAASAVVGCVLALR